MDLIFASNNKNKIIEIQKIIPDFFELKTLEQAGISDTIPEPFDSFRENALAKASFVHERTGRSCFSEDSGIVVDALNGQPGVHSARYAGEPADDEANNRKLLSGMEGVTNRTAHYQSTICLIFNNKIHYFEGQCYGTIAREPKGKGGFGYDPLFIPDSFPNTFAEMPIAEKLKISHRSRAFRKLAGFLKQQMI